MHIVSTEGVTVSGGHACPMVCALLTIAIVLSLEIYAVTGLQVPSSSIASCTQTMLHSCTLGDILRHQATVELTKFW